MLPLPGWAIIKPEEKKMEGMIELPESAQSAMQQGVIIEVEAIYHKDTSTTDLRKFIKKGDKVVFKKYHDNDLEVDGQKYKVVHIENIMVILN